MVRSSELMSKNGTVFWSKISIVPSELADFRVPFWIKSERDDNNNNNNDKQQTDEQEKSRFSIP